MNNVYLRDVNVEDKKLLYKWRNDTAVRKQSLNSQKITWEAHQEWFDKTYARDDIGFYMIMSQEHAVGTIRVEFNENCGVISYSIGKEYRGLGYGKNSLIYLVENIKQIRPCTILSGVVKEDNIYSIRAFEGAGFTGEKKGKLWTFTKRIE